MLASIIDWRAPELFVADLLADVSRVQGNQMPVKLTAARRTTARFAAPGKPNGSRGCGDVDQTLLSPGDLCFLTLLELALFDQRLAGGVSRSVSVPQVRKLLSDVGRSALPR